MDCNILNGGLIYKAGEKLIISDIHNYSGTLVYDANTKIKTSLDGVFWFMNSDHTHFYYSDQKSGNVLRRLDLECLREEPLLDKPCYGVFLSNEWIYYVNEYDSRLYRCLKNGKNEEKLADEQISSFLFNEGIIYYTSQQGIKMFSTSRRQGEKISDASAAVMIMVGNKLAFADRKKQYALTTLDVDTGSTVVFEEIFPGSINTDGKYLYCSNRRNDNTIYRVDPGLRSSIRICGDGADYIHIIESEIYFMSRFGWHKMSLLGGQAMKVN